MMRGYQRLLNRDNYAPDGVQPARAAEQKPHKKGRPEKYSHMQCTRCEKRLPVLPNNTRRLPRCACGGVLVYVTAYKAAGMKNVA
jgi:hypothetical protein